MGATIPKWPTSCTNAEACYKNCAHVDAAWTDVATDLMPEERITSHADCVTGAGESLRMLFDDQWGGSANNVVVCTFVDTDGTTVLKKQRVYKGGDATPPIVPPRAGYALSWNGTYTNLQDDTTVTLVATPVTVNVTLNYYQGAAAKTETQSVTYPNAYVVPSDYQRTGYDFVAWNPVQVDHFLSDTTIVAQYQIKTFDVAFSYYSGESETPTVVHRTVNYGGDATPPTSEEVKRTGYTFTGWSGTYTNVTSDQTVTAQYTPVTVTVTYDYYQGATHKVDTQEVVYPNAAVPPSDYKKTGYTFVSWNPSKTEKFVEDTTITAAYELTNERFVAVGQGVYSLSDGDTTWMNLSGASGTLYDVAYGNGRFVAVGFYKTYALSEGETTWTSLSGAAEIFAGVAYGDGRFVAVNGNGSSTYALADGSTAWASLNGALANLFGVAYGNGRFVAVGKDGNTCALLDGETTWTSLSGAEGLLHSVAYGNGRFIAVGGSGMAYALADGSTTWTSLSGASGDMFGVSYGNGRFVAVCKNSRATYSLADDETEWTSLGVTSIYMYGVSYGNGRFVAVGYSPSSALSPSVSLPDDETTWTSLIGASGAFNGVAYGSASMVALTAPAKKTARKATKRSSKKDSSKKA